MNPTNPDYRTVIEHSFRDAAFLVENGITFVDAGAGWCETMMKIAPRHMQHTGVLHAGIQATIADHTAGAAAMSLAGPSELILTSEFKIHLLRPGKGSTLWCRGEVLKPGRYYHVVEAEVYVLDDAEGAEHLEGARKTLISKLSATMAVLPKAA